MNKQDRELFFVVWCIWGQEEQILRYHNQEIAKFWVISLDQKTVISRFQPAKFYSSQKLSRDAKSVGNPASVADTKTSSL